MSKTNSTIYVWDPLIRIGHWSLVVAFILAYLTEDEFLNIHVWAGYVIGCVLIIRIIWGFTGTKYARFKNFAYPPKQVYGYIKSIIKNEKTARFIGHNPAGGAMIFTLLTSLIITTHSGLMVYAYEEQAGPLKFWVTDSLPIKPISTAYAHDDENETNSKHNDYYEKEEKHSHYEESEDFWEELHEFFANFTLALIVLHICGVILSSQLHRENLAKAMITGRKKQLDQTE